MNWCHREPTLEEMLSDPIVRALMDADGVDPHELKVTLKEVGRNLDAARSPRFWGQWSAGSQHVAI